MILQRGRFGAGSPPKKAEASGGKAITMDAGIMEPRRVMLRAVLFAIVFGQAAAGQARTRMYVEPFANGGGSALREVCGTVELRAPACS